MSNLTKAVNLPLQNNVLPLVSNNAPVASNENNLGNLSNNSGNNMIVRMTKNIPVDVNSEVPLHERWNSAVEKCPPPVPNGGLYGGPQAVGEHASIHVIPTATNMIHHNLRSANPPPGAINQYPGTNRDKNNYVAMPGVCWYADTHPVNTGPFSIKVIDTLEL